MVLAACPLSARRAVTGDGSRSFPVENQRREQPQGRLRALFPLDEDQPGLGRAVLCDRLDPLGFNPVGPHRTDEVGEPFRPLADAQPPAGSKELPGSGADPVQRAGKLMAGDLVRRFGREDAAARRFVGRGAGGEVESVKGELPLSVI